MLFVFVRNDISEATRGDVAKSSAVQKKSDDAPEIPKYFFSLLSTHLSKDFPRYYI